MSAAPSDSAERQELPGLVLASASPRRQQLLRALGVAFKVRIVQIDEASVPEEDPRAYVRRVAQAKAKAAQGSLEAAGDAGDTGANEIILAADTIVTIGGRILGKPADSSQAIHMLGELRGREHIVLTEVVVVDGRSGRLVSGTEETQVRVGPLSDAEVRWYVGTGEPLDKAGSYAIQGLGAVFVDSISGNYTNVVGLPLPLTRRLLGELGFDLLEFARNEDRRLSLSNDSET